MSALTSSIAAIWSGVSVYGNASSSSRCHGVSGANACPGADALAAYSCTSFAAICRTALRARPLVFAQSAPPSLFSVGTSPPTYRDSRSSASVGTKSRSPGWPRLLGAYSTTRYSRVAPPAVRCTMSMYLPMPCWACTT